MTQASRRHAGSHQAVEGGEDSVERAEIVREGCTMALYVALCLLAAFAALPEKREQSHTVVIIWGTTIGLALAHWFAFRVSAGLVGEGKVRRTDVAAASAQLAGAGAVAVLASIPALLIPRSHKVDVAMYVLAAFIATIGYVVARSGGGTRTRSVIYAGAVLIGAVAVAAAKNALATH